MNRSISTQLTRRAMMQAVAGAVAFAGSRQAVRAAALPAVTVAVQPIEPSAQPFYADANGYFEKAGVSADVTVLATSPAVVQAVVSGTYDIGSATVTTLAAAHAKGLPVVMIAPQGVVDKSIFQGGIVVSPSSTIKGPRDLQRKVFAVSGLGTPAEYFPRSWVDMNGGDSTTIKFVEVPFPAIGEAIAAGHADAAYLNEPFYTIATKKGQVKLLSTGNEALPRTYLSTAWFATTAWAKEHADVIPRFARALNRAGAWARANPDKVVPILESKLKLDPAMLALVHRATFGDKLVDAQIQPWIDIVAKYQKFPRFPASDLIFRG